MSDTVVQLQSGIVRGVFKKHEEGFTYYSFKGIPYAEPPVGELRFEDPLPIRRWTGVKDCQKCGPRCLQYDSFTKESYYSENCLHLNVFTHAINKPSVNNPVIVFLQGGLFGSACDFYYGHEYFISKNIVLVFINSRLGVLGFLDLEDKICPIKQFCGNPNNVTICGISTGGVAAHLLALSPLTKDKELVDSKEILKFLKTVNSKLLQEAQESLRRSSEYLPFAPGVDSKSANPLMPIHPDIVASQGVHLPYLLGYTSRKGLIFMLEMQGEVLKQFDRDPEQIFKFNTKNVLNYHNCIHKFIRVQSERSSAATYLYRFEYDSPATFIKAFVNNTPKGAFHYDELYFLFKMRICEVMKLPFVRKGTRNYRIMERMTEMWANFAIYGMPTVDTTDLIPVRWKPIASGTLLRFLNIDEDLTMQYCINLDQKFLSAKSIKV